MIYEVGNKGRMLVFDDEGLPREMLKDALSEGGFDVLIEQLFEKNLRKKAEVQ